MDILTCLKIQLVEKHWGGFERKDDPTFDVIEESPFNDVVEKEVWGPEAERLYMGFRFDGANTEQSRMLTMMDMVLSNSSAGLIDSGNVDTSIFGTGKFYQEQEKEKKENIYSDIDDMLNQSLKSEEE